MLDEPSQTNQSQDKVVIWGGRSYGRWGGKTRGNGNAAQMSYSTGGGAFSGGADGLVVDGWRTGLLAGLATAA